MILTGSLRNSDASRWMSVGHVALNISVCGAESLGQSQGRNRNLLFSLARTAAALCTLE